MSEKDSRFENDGQEAPTPRTGLRASNTVATLTPREVLPLQGRGLPPIDYEEDVRKVDWPTATLPSPGYAGAPADVPPEVEEQVGNVLPVDWPTAAETMGFRSDSLYARVDRLEEQMDGLLDRLAKFNFKASHKI